MAVAAMDVFVPEDYVTRRRVERSARALRNDPDRDRPAKRKERAPSDRGTKVRFAARWGGEEEDIVLNCFTP